MGLPFLITLNNFSIFINTVLMWHEDISIGGCANVVIALLILGLILRLFKLEYRRIILFVVNGLFLYTFIYVSVAEREAGISLVLWWAMLPYVLLMLAGLVLYKKKNILGGLLWSSFGYMCIDLLLKAIYFPPLSYGKTSFLSLPFYLPVIVIVGFVLFNIKNKKSMSGKG